MARLVVTLDPVTLPCASFWYWGIARTPPGLLLLALDALTRSSKLVPTPLKPTVCALARLSEILPIALDCALRPETAVVRAEKSEPMIHLSGHRHRFGRSCRTSGSGAV